MPWCLPLYHLALEAQFDGTNAPAPERQRRRWRGDAVSVPHFMGEQRRFWGQISEYAWLERRGLRRKWLGEYFSGRPGTIVHFVIGERMDIRTLDEMTIEVGEGA